MVYTPRDLAKSLVEKVKPSIDKQRLDEDKPFDVKVMDPFLGDGAFFDYFPNMWVKKWAEIEKGVDFFEWTEPVDWCISNPPWSMVDKVLEHTCEISTKGFAYLLNNHGCTPRRLEICEEAGFGLTQMHLSKVFEWYGIAAFCVFEKGAESIISYDRKVWRPE